MGHLVGIDVSVESCAVCVVNPSGAVAREARVACEPEALIAVLGGLDLDIACVGLEAGLLSQWLVRYLREAGFETVLMETRQVKGALKAMRSRPTDATRSASLRSFAWAGSARCIASPSRHRSCARCSGRAERFRSR